jgi:hypothetical protein
MELDRALELAVISSWEDLVAPHESCSIHVVYENLPDLPLNSVEVWRVKNRGYENLICRYSISPSDSRLHFANSYRSKTLADNLDFIMRNQGQFRRTGDQSLHGLVQIDSPSEADKKSAIAWRHPVRLDVADTRDALKKAANPGPGGLISKGEGPVPSDKDPAKPTEEQIRQRAYEIYEAGGRQDGKELDDWIRAERELLEQSNTAGRKTRAVHGR